MNIIFDFDGTIANSLPLAVDIINKWGIADELDLEKARKDGIKKTLTELDLSKVKLAYYLAKARKIMSQRINEIQIFDGMSDVIDQLSKKHRLGILTSNSSENVESFLKNNDLQKFNFIYAEYDLFGKSNKLRKIIKEQSLSIDETVYVGDETRDIEAAKDAGIRSIAVTWGYETKEVIEKADPDIVISKPSELLNILNIQV